MLGRPEQRRAVVGAGEDDRGSERGEQRSQGAGAGVLVRDKANTIRSPG